MVVYLSPRSAEHSAMVEAVERAHEQPSLVLAVVVPLVPQMVRA